MVSVVLFVDRVTQISTSISVTNAIKCVSWCSRTNVPAVRQSFIIRRFAAHDASINDDDFDVEYVYVRERASNKKETVFMLQDIFGCSGKEVESMVRKCPDLKFVTAKNAHNNVQLFKERGVPEEILHQNPWLLTYKTGALSYKLNILKKMNLDDVTTVIPLLQFSVMKLRDLAALAEKESLEVPHGSRIRYTCAKLQCSLADVCEEFQKHEFLFTIPFGRFAAILDLLLGAGVSPQYILRDMWIFRYNVDSIAERLEMAKEAGIRTIKPWMLRSSHKTFSNTLRREASRKEVLGESTVAEYLSQQLQCDLQTVEYLSSKYPSLLSVHVSKLKEILDFVYGEGYTPQHVCHVPRILLHSIETTKTRLTELRDLGYNPPSLIVLCKSKREYAKFLERLLRKKNG